MIHSPSKVMAEMGDYIIQGLFNSISDGIAEIKSIFEKMVTVIKSAFFGIGDWFKCVFSEAWNNITAIFDAVKGYFTDRWNDMISVFCFAGEWFGNVFLAAWNNITAVFNAVKGYFSDRWNDMISVFCATGSWFGNTFRNAWNEIAGIFGGIGGWFADRFQSAYDNITGIFSGLGGFFSGIWDDVGNMFKGGINWVIDILNELISSMNNINFSIPDWVPNVGGKSFGINIPEIPRLAKGGLAYAPTLAMVGDNSNASSDPEVISPLSKLKGMIGNENSEILETLKSIAAIIENGQIINLSVANQMYPDARAFRNDIIGITTKEKSRRGGVGF